MRSSARWLLVLGALPLGIACAAGQDVAVADDVPATRDAGKMDVASPSPAPTPAPTSSNEDAGAPKPPPDPIVFVHGINGRGENFKVMIDRFGLDGWPTNRLWAITFADPAFGCNGDNAEALKAYVAKVLADTGATKIDLVVHSMGNLSSRRFMKALGGTAVVSSYVALGGPNRGVPLACLNPLPVCVHQELCPSSAYLADINTPPVTPGPTRWVSIYSNADDTVPPSSSPLDGAENIAFDGVDHDGPNGLLQRADVYAEVKRVVQYPHP